MVPSEARASLQPSRLLLLDAHLEGGPEIAGSVDQRSLSRTHAKQNAIFLWVDNRAEGWLQIVACRNGLKRGRGGRSFG
jgi:hypothetical protein